jgi:hypothetical protein
VQISVQVQPDLAAAVHGRESPTAEVDDLNRSLEELGLSLQPVHPGADDPLLAPYFTVEVPDDEELAVRVLAVLEESGAVEAAYVKPPAEPP